MKTEQTFQFRKLVTTKTIEANGYETKVLPAFEKANAMHANSTFTINPFIAIANFNSTQHKTATFTVLVSLAFDSVNLYFATALVEITGHSKLIYRIDSSVIQCDYWKAFYLYVYLRNVIECFAVIVR